MLHPEAKNKLQGEPSCMYLATERVSHHHRLHEHHEQREQLGDQGGPRQPIRNLRRGVLGGPVSDELREGRVGALDAQAEVDKDPVTALPHQNIVSLDVSLDEPVPVQQVDGCQNSGQGPGNKETEGSRGAGGKMEHACVTRVRVVVARTGDRRGVDTHMSVSSMSEVQQGLRRKSRGTGLRREYLGAEMYKYIYV